MLDKRSEFGKQYVRLLVEEIRVEGQTAVMRGSYAAPAQVVGIENVGTAGGVPRFEPGWLPTQHSNAGCLDALSSLAIRLQVSEEADRRV